MAVAMATPSSHNTMWSEDVGVSVARLNESFVTRVYYVEQKDSEYRHGNMTA